MQSLSILQPTARKPTETQLDELIGGHSSPNEERNLLLFVFITTLWTFIMTLIPVIVEVGPDTYYKGHPSWYTGNDVIRFLEPIGGLPLNFIFLWKSGIFRDDMTRGSIFCVIFFMFGAALYQQGAGFHSCSNMIKNAVETIIVDDDVNVPPQNNELENLYFYVRTVWEHAVSHYLYGVGMVFMNFCQLFAFRNYKSVDLQKSRFTKYGIIASSFVLGLLIFGVSLDFPSGTIVTFVYLVVYGLLGVGGFVYHEYRVKEDQDIILLGNRPIVQHFFLGYCWAFVMLILWIIAIGGFKSRHAL